MQIGGHHHTAGDTDGNLHPLFTQAQIRQRLNAATGIDKPNATGITAIQREIAGVVQIQTAAELTQMKMKGPVLFPNLYKFDDIDPCLPR